MRRVIRTDNLEVGCSGSLLHLAPSISGSGERDFADVHVFSEERAGLARAGHDVDDSWREASSSDEFAQADGLTMEGPSYCIIRSLRANF